MQRQHITSSSLESVGYDEDSQTLEIEFKKGTVYEYLSVPSATHNGLMNADSHGKYFRKYILEKFTTVKIR